VRLLGAVVALLGAWAGPLPARAAPDAPPPPEFVDSFGGLTTGLDLQSSRIGYGALGELGVRALATRSLDERRWLARWDLSLTTRGGLLGSALPVTPLLGVRARAEGELGRRLVPRARWSPYAQAEGVADLQWLTPPSPQPAGVNDMTGTGGFIATGRVRLGFGASYLDARHALVAVAFIQEALRPTAIDADGVAFTDAGLECRYDVARRFTLLAEASWGWAEVTRNAALGATDRTTHLQATGGARAWLTGRMWLGLAATAARDDDRLAYAASNASYATRAIPDVRVTISYGLELGAR
jgi:hypothetical protein